MHGDQGYSYSHPRRWLRKRGITHHIAPKGIEPPTGPARWTIERTMF
ncbi:hypothetical protein [Streptomyces sirii]